jgi:F-box and WD-40 domain protein 1/11
MDSEQPSGGALSKPGLTTAASLAASFKLDEGYSDDTKSQPENDAAVSQSEEAMLLPQCIFSHTEAERAGTC